MLAQLMVLDRFLDAGTRLQEQSDPAHLPKHVCHSSYCQALGSISKKPLKESHCGAIHSWLLSRPLTSNYPTAPARGTEGSGSAAHLLQLVQLLLLRRRSLLQCRGTELLVVV